MFTELFLILAIVTMGIGAIGLWALSNQGPCLMVRRWSEITAFVSLAFGLAFSTQFFIANQPVTSNAFQVSALQAILVPYILMMGIVVKRFAYHYLQTDKQYPLFFLKIKALIFSLLLFVVANHVLVLLFAWSLSGWILCQLIKHTGTIAEKNAAAHSWKTFMIGDGFMAAGVFLLSTQSASYLIDSWSMTLNSNSPFTLLGLSLLVISALTKTANIPFSSWLPHTLTAPTPVSAIMHAGFVNSGAILFAKLAPILIQFPLLMAGILTIGLVSALWGSFAMMVQPDVKRYLTYSTIGQMGFMMMECGLGAFHLAIGHLIVHGLFKSRLFLASGSVIEQRRAIRNVKHRINHQPRTSNITLLGTIALMTTTVFTLTIFKTPEGNQLTQLPSVLFTTLVLSVAFSQTTLLKTKGVRPLGIILALIFSTALITGYIVYDQVATNVLLDLNQYHTLKNTPYHTLIAWVMGILGTLMLLVTTQLITLPQGIKMWGYVHLLNANNTLKNATTFTHRRTQYQYNTRN